MYGIGTLKKIKKDYNDVECPVCNCKHVVKRRTKNEKIKNYDFLCRDHGIYIFSSTFAYKDYLDNILWRDKNDESILADILGNKMESRTGHENSEDALTWNIFRFFHKEKKLDDLTEFMTKEVQKNSRIIYWSYDVKNNQVYEHLKNARDAFESQNKRGVSEPDIIIESDQSIILIEAKLTASVNTSMGGTDKSAKYIEGANMFYKKCFNKDVDLTDLFSKNKKYELGRFWLLGNFMAYKAKKQFFLISLVGKQQDRNAENEFGKYIINKERYKRITWEEIYDEFIKNNHDNAEYEKVANYLENKTIGYSQNGKLKRAFNV